MEKLIAFNIPLWYNQDIEEKENRNGNIQRNERLQINSRQYAQYGRLY